MGIFIVPEFKNMKFCVKDEEHSKKIQEHLFSLGYGWLGDSSTIMFVSMPYLSTDNSGKIGYGYNNESFDSLLYPEYQLKETKSYSLEEIKPKSKIGKLTVKVNLELTVNGEKVSLNNLEDIVSKLKATDVVKFKVEQ